MKFQFTIPIEPVAWERVKRGKYGNAYVPPKTEKFKMAVALYANSIVNDHLLEGPLRLTARFILTKPTSVDRVRPWVRPDLDNYLKALKDGLNGAVYKDDAQIVEFGDGTGKYYDQSGGRGRIEVLIEELEP